MDNKDNREPPPGVIVASNGAWQDEKTKRFVKGGKPVTAITSDNSIEYHRIRKQKQLDGMLQANRRLYDLSVDYWGDVAESMYNTSTDGKGVAAVQAARMVGEMTGYLAGRGAAGDDGPPPAGMRLELGADAVIALAGLLADREKG